MGSSSSRGTHDAAMEAVAVGVPGARTSSNGGRKKKAKRKPWSVRAAAEKASHDDDREEIMEAVEHGQLGYFPVYPVWDINESPYFEAVALLVRRHLSSVELVVALPARYSDRFKPYALALDETPDCWKQVSDADSDADTVSDPMAKRPKKSSRTPSEPVPSILTAIPFNGLSDISKREGQEKVFNYLGFAIPPSYRPEMWRHTMYLFSQIGTVMVNRGLQDDNTAEGILAREFLAGLLEGNIEYIDENEFEHPSASKDRAVVFKYAVFFPLRDTVIRVSKEACNPDIKKHVLSLSKTLRGLKGCENQPEKVACYCPETGQVKRQSLFRIPLSTLSDEGFFVPDNGLSSKSDHRDVSDYYNDNRNKENIVGFFG